MDIAVPDLAVVFETHQGFTPPKPPRQAPDPTPPSNTSDSSAGTLAKEIQASGSRKSLPRPVTQNHDRVKRIGGPPSFAFGLLLGVLPFLIVVRLLVVNLRNDTTSDWRLQERWFKYGRSIGFILLLVVIIVLLIELT